MYYVIGSGPAGAACASTLLARGLAVCMVDAGFTLETDVQRRVESLGRRAPAEWAEGEAEAVKGAVEASAKGIMLKRSFGSDFPYRGAAEHLQLSPGMALKPSHAFGGLSNVWGAAAFPYKDSDLAGWPVKEADLAEGYRAAVKITGLAAERDALEREFPLYTDLPFALRPSRQAQAFRKDLERNERRLTRSGISFGSSRLAVKDCAYCTLCMYGCPYGYIYNSASTITALLGNPLFTYLPGIVVTQVKEAGDGVSIVGYRRDTREAWQAEGSRAFIAAGVLPTAKIVLASLEAYERPLQIKDSQYFLFPIARLARTRGVQKELAHTMGQLFLEIEDAALSEHTIHVQVYSYSDAIGHAIRGALGPLKSEWLARNLEERLLIAQAYLHSDLSSQIRITLKKVGSESRLEAEDEINPVTSRKVRAVVRKLLRQAPFLRAAPLEPMLQIAPPGRGFHSGGTFPMRKSPGVLETDLLGELRELRRVHLVDSSVFPTIPATTITLSVMANACRIAAAVEA